MRGKTNLIILFALMVLFLVTLSCGLLPGSEDPTPTPESEVAEAEPMEPPVEPTDQPPPTDPPAPDVPLGKEVRVDEGGFAFHVVPDYIVDVFGDMATMDTPDEDNETGPNFMLISDIPEGSTDLDGAFDKFMTEMANDGVEIYNQRDVNVAGSPGRMVDIKGQVEEGEPMEGRIAVVLATPNQVFVMMGAAVPDHWPEGSDLFDAVLDSVTFFEPTLIPDDFDEPDLPAEPEVATSPTGKKLSQWAEFALASSEYSDPAWGAIQATGKPNTEGCGDIDTAWASLESTSVDWLELYYEFEVIPTKVRVFQTMSPNQVVKVELIGTDGEFYEVYNEPPRVEECPFILTVPVIDAGYEVMGVRLTIDQSILSPTSWNEIDAVELTGISTE